MEKSDAIAVITGNVVKVIDNRFSSENVPQSLLNYLYLATTGMCISLGTDYVDDIFNNIKNISFTNRIKFYSEKEYLVLSKFNEDLQISYQFYIKDNKNGNINTLEFITRELINLLCGNNTRFDDKILSDVLKNLEVEDVINIIASLRDFNIKDRKFKKALDYFKDFNIDEYSVSGYETIVNLFRPLFKYENLKEFFIKNLVDNDFLNIYEEFDSILGVNSFKNMIDSLKTINSKLNRKNVPTYEIACSYLNIRNKFVQSYINSKFNII